MSYVKKVDGDHHVIPPSHNPVFRATVVVKGATFKSSSAFKTSKAANNDVAEIAFTHFLTFSHDEVPIDDIKKIDKVKVPASSEDGTEAPIAVKQKIKKTEVPTKSSNSDVDSGTLNETSESRMSIFPEDEATTIELSDHFVLSINKPNPTKSVETFLLCNKIRVHTSIPDMVLPKGTVVLPIGYDKCTVVSLESA